MSAQPESPRLRIHWSRCILRPSLAIRAAGGGCRHAGAAAPRFFRCLTGKTVAWDYSGKSCSRTNHECPYVKKHYRTSNMQAIRRRPPVRGDRLRSSPSAPTSRVVSAGQADELTKRAARRRRPCSRSHGRGRQMCGATNTPHMYVIDRRVPSTRAPRRQAEHAEERRARRPELRARGARVGGGGPAGEDARHACLRLHREVRVISRRRLLHGAAAMAAAAAWPRPALAQVTDAGRAAMAGAATAFLGALPDDARRRAVIAFGDKERFNWHYVPRGREGLPFKAMPAPARAAAHELMKASLSAVGGPQRIRLETVCQLETFGGSDAGYRSPCSARRIQLAPGGGASKAIICRSSHSCRVFVACAGIRRNLAVCSVSRALPRARAGSAERWPRAWTRPAPAMTISRRAPRARLGPGARPRVGGPPAADLAPRGSS